MIFRHYAWAAVGVGVGAALIASAAMQGCTSGSGIDPEATSQVQQASD
jgi:F0F1-type ATP synthase membrane subunit c/vacuolar-type H+-ATPase subunit K